MKHMFLLAILITVVQAAFAVEIDLSKVELGYKAQKALDDFQSQSDREFKDYLKSMNRKRDSTIRDLESAMRKEDNQLVQLKIQAEIDKLKALAPVNIFGQVVVPDQSDKIVVEGTKWKALTTGETSKWEFSANRVLLINGRDWNAKYDSNGKALTVVFRNGKTVIFNLPLKTGSVGKVTTSDQTYALTDL